MLASPRGGPLTLGLAESPPLEAHLQRGRKRPRNGRSQLGLASAAARLGQAGGRTGQLTNGAARRIGVRRESNRTVLQPAN